MAIYLTDEQHALAVAAVGVASDLQNQLQNLSACGANCAQLQATVSQAMTSLQNILHYFSSPSQSAGGAIQAQPIAMPAGS